MLLLLATLTLPASAGRKNKPPAPAQCKREAGFQVDAARNAARERAQEAFEQSEAERWTTLRADAEACLHAQGSACMGPIETFVAAAQPQARELPAQSVDIATACGLTRVQRPVQGFALRASVWEEARRFERLRGQPGPLGLDVVLRRDGSAEYQRMAHEKRVQSMNFLRDIMDKQVQGSRAEMMLRLAQLHVEEGSYQLGIGDSSWHEHFTQARTLFSALLRDFPRYPRASEALYGLGLAAEGLGDGEAAVLHFSQLVKQYPQSSEVGPAYVHLGEHFAEKQNAYKALLAYRKAGLTATGPLLTYAQYRMAWCYWEVGEADKAKANLRLVLETPPGKHAGLSDLVYAARGDLERWRLSGG